MLPMKSFKSMEHICGYTIEGLKSTPDGREVTIVIDAPYAITVASCKPPPASTWTSSTVTAPS
jgi:hypothetical protein